MRFWDSSAVVPLCVTEPNSRAADAALKADPDMVVWWGAEIECISALMRRHRDGLLTDQGMTQARQRLTDLGKAWSVIEPSSAIKSDALRALAVHPLRSADAVQLAAALVWADHAPEGRTMVCCDERLRKGARAEGFDIVPDELVKPAARAKAEPKA